MKIDPTTQNSFKDLGDKVVIFDDLATDIIYDNVSYPDSSPESVQAFLNEFKIVGRFVGDSNEDYYQGIHFTQVIQHNFDYRRFGFTYWKDISKYGETFVESNGDDHGYGDWDIPEGFNYDEDYYPEAFVFLPIKPFTVQGFEVVE